MSSETIKGLFAGTLNFVKSQFLKGGICGILILACIVFLYWLTTYCKIRSSKSKDEYNIIHLFEKLEPNKKTGNIEMMFFYNSVDFFDNGLMYSYTTSSSEYVYWGHDNTDTYTAYNYTKSGYSVKPIQIVVHRANGSTDIFKQFTENVVHIDPLTNNNLNTVDNIETNKNSVSPLTTLTK